MSPRQFLDFQINFQKNELNHCRSEFFHQNEIWFNASHQPSIARFLFPRWSIGGKKNSKFFVWKIRKRVFPLARSLLRSRIVKGSSKSGNNISTVEIQVAWFVSLPISCNGGSTIYKICLRCKFLCDWLFDT